MWGQVSQPRIAPELKNQSDVMLGASLIGQSFQRVNDVATLRSIPVSETRIIQTAGVDANGRGGGFWQGVTGAAPGTYVDNIGWIVVPSGGDGSAAWLRVMERSVRPEQFGAACDLTQDDSAAVQAAADYAINQSGVLVLGYQGEQYRLDNQVVITAGAGVRGHLDIVGGRNTKIVSNVVGSVAGYDTAGFAILFDGWRESRMEGVTIDTTNGTAGIAIRCRNESCYQNVFSDVYFIGGAALIDREPVSNIAVRLIGNESVSSSTGNVCYYNAFRNCRFNFHHKQIESVTGDGFATTKEPNATRSSDCHFERYIVAVDAGETDENIHRDAWFNQSPGVAGIEGGKTYCFSTSGNLNHFSGVMEPGADSSPYRLIDPAFNNVIDIIANTTLAGENLSTLKNLVSDRTTIKGITQVNNFAYGADGDGDVDFFGGSGLSQSGSFLHKLRVWFKLSSVTSAAFGWVNGSVFGIGPDQVGKALQLSESWEKPIKLGNSYLWSNAANGKLYTKFGSMPSSDTDGVIVGTQS